jgi:squamous cell carcinoma antigen recognized by T-cells 3
MGRRRALDCSTSRMDEEQALEALSNVISALSETPFDLSLHGQHIQLALATGMDDQIRAARDTLTVYYACGDDVWLPLIEDKKGAADLETVDGVLSVLTAYKRAEDDYLCTRLLYSDHRTRLFDLNSHPFTSPAYRLLDQQIFPFLFLRCETHSAR